MLRAGTQAHEGSQARGLRRDMHHEVATSAGTSSATAVATTTINMAAIELVDRGQPPSLLFMDVDPSPGLDLKPLSGSKSIHHTP